MTNRNEIHASIELLIIGSERWQSFEPPHMIPRKNHGIAQVNSKEIVIVGGDGSNLMPINVIEVFDIATCTVRRAAK